ncbi:BTAD domain-containing putative transcriptional regulator [Streptomyces sp. NPDC050428]|uniref:BTAD domain-containing putative transcriptional regulator n=1 Tax=Streptomyces sp. NPDC050428 TaxID=3155757 RepID=UPI00343F10AE
MKFKLLGPFEAHHEGRRLLTDCRRQERCLLSILLLDAGHAVTTDRLIDLLWDREANASARGTVHTYIGRLRAALRTGLGPRIETRHDGYLLEAGGYEVDAQDFVPLARAAADATDPAERIRLCDRALALWRGPLLADVAGARLRERLGGRLDALRLSTVELRAETQLSMGLHDQVVADLTVLADEHPERERIVAAQMTALYRGDRAAEAVRLYRVTRHALSERLGVEPGPDLTALHQRVLRRDPALDRPPAPLYAVRVRDHWLPWNTSGHPALEFCNTYAGWGGPRLPGSEWLRDYAALAVWAGHLDLAEDHVVTRLITRARHAPGEAAAVLAEARDFRARLYACLTDPADTGAFKAVADVAEAAAKSSVFTRGGDGLGRWRISPSAGLRLPLYATARSAADLLTDPRRFVVRGCPNEECGWLFLDGGGRRRWCSLATCGASRQLRDGCAAG